MAILTSKLNQNPTDCQSFLVLLHWHQVSFDLSFPWLICLYLSLSILALFSRIFQPLSTGFLARFFYLNCPLQIFLYQEKIYIEFIFPRKHLLVPNLYFSHLYLRNTWNELIEYEAISIHSRIVLMKSFNENKNLSNELVLIDTEWTEQSTLKISTDLSGIW